MQVLTSALSQIWPPFVLVLGLLLIGRVAASDRLFEAAGSRLAQLPGGAYLLFFAMMALVAAVTVVLNLDTSVVFLTPTLLQTARQRRIPERPFLYGAIFMSNASSLLLPGSNLTNLLVIGSRPVNGARFAAAMGPAWIAAIVVTAAFVALWCRADLRRPAGDLAPPVSAHIGLGLLGVVMATVLVLVTARPALAVFGVGLFLVIGQSFLLRRLHLLAALRATNVGLVLGLFAVAVAAGALAREWELPRHLMGHANAIESAAVGGGVADLVNNLPAAVLLSATTPLHPRELLIGLDLGPNLVVFGAMSSLLWLKIGRAQGAQPSSWTFTRIGLLLVPLSAGAALLAGHLIGTGAL